MTLDQRFQVYRSRFTAVPLRQRVDKYNTAIPIQRVPLYVVGMLNGQLSYFGSLAFRYGAEHCLPALAATFPALFYGDQANLDFFHWNDSATGPGIGTTWWHSSAFAAALVFPLFYGVEGFFPRNPVHREKAAHFFRITQTERALHAAYDCAAVSPFGRALEAVDRTLMRVPLVPWLAVKQVSKVTAYITYELFRRGIIGANDLVGTLFPQQIDWIVCAKQRMTSSKNNLVNFFGRVTPSRLGEFVGFSIDLAANAAADIMHAYIFNPNIPLSDIILPGIGISSLVGYANTRISQSEDFDYGDKVLLRTGIAIAKAGVYRGLCSIETITPLFNYVGLQLGFGIAAIYFSDCLARRAATQNAAA